VTITRGPEEVAMSTKAHGANGTAILRLRPRPKSSVAALLAVLGAVTMVTVASASSGPLLQSGRAGPYAGILVNSGHHSLYANTSERGGKIHCRGACFSFWPPVLVKNSVTSVTLGAGVKGKIGFIRRSSTTRQVTFNGFPVYRFSGDGAGQANGEGVPADGGTWYLVNAGSRSPSTTHVKVHHGTTTTTTAPHGTTTTSPNGTTTTGPTTTIYQY
jgi:predicted lipoprotein with Yx(FWY)xxD motif